MNFGIIKSLREHIVFDKMGFDEAWNLYKNDYDRKEFGRLWNKACCLVKDDSYLSRTIIATMNEFSNVIASYYEEGFDEKSISEKIHMPMQFVKAML